MTRAPLFPFVGWLVLAAIVVLLVLAVCRPISSDESTTPTPRPTSAPVATTTPTTAPLVASTSTLPAGTAISMPTPASPSRRQP